MPAEGGCAQWKDVTIREAFLRARDIDTPLWRRNPVASYDSGGQPAFALPVTWTFVPRIEGDDALFHLCHR